MTEDRYASFDYNRLIEWDQRLAREWPFLERVLADAPARTLLDLGSGTGEHARFIASKGFVVTGVDSSAAMLEKSRAAAAGEPVRFLEGDMRTVDTLFDERFGAAICLGNALPHLTGESDLAQLARSVRTVLLAGAPFVVQLVNYERMALKGERALPLKFLPDPDDPKASLIFLRAVEMLPEGRVIFMPTQLRLRSDQEVPIEVVGSRRVEVRGWRRDELDAVLRKAGFAKVDFFGAFDGVPFDAAESRDIIVVAR